MWRMGACVTPKKANKLTTKNQIKSKKSPSQWRSPSAHCAHNCSSTYARPMTFPTTAWVSAFPHKSMQLEFGEVPTNIIRSGTRKFSATLFAQIRLDYWAVWARTGTRAAGPAF